MKKILLTLAICITGFCFAQKDYIITIDGKDYEVSLNEKQNIKINGKAVDVTVKQKDTITHTDDYFNFKYTKDHKITKAEIESGVEQLMLVTAGGTGVIIQSYDFLDPSMLKEMMLNEVTKESISYGYKMERKDYDLTLASGEKIRILKAVLEYRGEVEIYEVAAHGKKDEGILIMTMDMNLTTNDGGKDMIKLMWDSIEMK